MICDIIRPEGMSRPVGTAMQAKPGTDMACGMIRPEGLSRPVGTAMQAKQAGYGHGLWHDPPRRHEPPCGHGH
jgi:hypothetical protein